MSIIILKNHIAANDTIVYKNFMGNGHNFFKLDDSERVNEFKSFYGIQDDDFEWVRLLDAINKGTGDVSNSDFLPVFVQQYCATFGADEKIKPILVQQGSSSLLYMYLANVEFDKEIRQALLDKANPMYAYRYLRNVADDREFEQVILDSDDNNPKWSNEAMFEQGFATQFAYLYCNKVKKTQEMVDKILSSNSAKYIYCYAKNCADKSELPRIRKEIIRACKNSKEARSYFWLYNYCENIENHDNVVKALISSGDASACYFYCARIEANPKVKQVVLDSDDEYADCYRFLYCLHVSNDEDMRNRLLLSGNAEFIAKYCEQVSNDEDMKQALIATKDAKWIVYYCANVEDSDELLNLIEAI